MLYDDKNYNFASIKTMMVKFITAMCTGNAHMQEVTVFKIHLSYHVCIHTVIFNSIANFANTA